MIFLLDSVAAAPLPFMAASFAPTLMRVDGHAKINSLGLRKHRPACV